MYFLSDEERRLLLRRLLPQARHTAVAEELRGWNWHQPPLAPIYEARLGVYEVAGQYCASGRDVYLRRVRAIQRPPNQAMREGICLHRVLVSIIVAAKRLIYTCAVPDLTSAVENLSLPQPVADAEGALGPQDAAQTEQRMHTLWRFEQRRILARIEEALARQPSLGPDALAALALPVLVEQRLDGVFLGLSSHLSADAFTLAEAMVLDVKFGRPQPFHRLSTTGYALVMESLYEYPINLGCTVYARFVDDRVVIERDFHVLSDELRTWFVEARDERARLVEEEVDPGLAAQCDASCPYTDVCHGREPGRAAQAR